MNFFEGSAKTRKGRIAKLKNLIELLNLGKNSFSPEGDMFGPPSVTIKKGEIRAFIADRTRLWRETWVLPTLQELLAHEEAGRKKAKP